jgi:hypothetical protein
MSFTSYRATRDISLGQLRRTIRAGDVVEFDGATTRVDGRDFRISTMDTIIATKWLVPLDVGATAIVVSAPALPAVPSVEPPMVPPPPKVELTAQGERIPFASKEAARVSGIRPGANEQHVWIAADFGSNDLLCRVCGVTWERSLIRVDRTMGNGKQQFHYRDAHHQPITSFEELSCPLYLGDANSASAYAKDQVRKVRGRVDTVEVHLGTVDERLNQLQADNDFLRQRILDMPRLDAEMVADALVLLATRQGTAPQLTEQLRTLLLPAPPLVEPDIIDREREAVLVEVFHPDGTGDPDSRP